MKHVTDHLDKGQVDLVLNAAKVCNTRDYLMLRVFWRTGIRASELLAIRPHDIERANNIINITRAKGGKERRVPLDPETVQGLSDYVLANKIPDDRPVFAITQQQVRNIVKRYSQSIGVRAHPHTFRHSFAIHCVRNGWDIRRLQQVLGHSSLNVTAVYLQFKDTTSRNCTTRRRFSKSLFPTAPRHDVNASELSS